MKIEIGRKVGLLISIYGIYNYTAFHLLFSAQKVYMERKIVFSVEFVSNFCNCTKTQVKIAQPDDLEVEYKTVILAVHVRFSASTHFFF